MKDSIQQVSRRLGVYYALTYLRQLPGIIRWLRVGCPTPAPHYVKMNIVRAYLREYALRRFIETGTYLGDTLGYIAREGIECTSIELSTDLYAKAKQRFVGVDNITLIEGDSGVAIREVLNVLNEPALFWLDGHWSGGITATAAVDTPIRAELDAILQHQISGHVVLIDDARHFNGKNHYPHLDELLAIVRRDARYSAEVSSDIIRLIPANRPEALVPN